MHSNNTSKILQLDFSPPQNDMIHITPVLTDLDSRPVGFKFDMKAPLITILRPLTAGLLPIFGTPYEPDCCEYGAFNGWNSAL